MILVWLKIDRMNFLIAKWLKYNEQKILLNKHEVIQKAIP
jgi:hypothetical protein